MTKENGYTEWTDHPKWEKLVMLCNDIEILEEEASKLRYEIQIEVYGKD